MSNPDPPVSPVQKASGRAQCAIQRIISVIPDSPLPEDPVHSSNTLEWLLKLAPNADEALCIAALGHDIDRAAGTRRIRKADFHDFDEFKAAHAKNSARILKEILEHCGLDESVTQEVFRLVCLHETGGDERSDLLNHADSLSFFEVNLPFYWDRHSVEETLHRCSWGFKRLSHEMRGIVKQFTYTEKRLHALVQQVILARHK